MPPRGRPRKHQTAESRRAARQESQRRYNLSRRNPTSTIGEPANIVPEIPLAHSELIASPVIPESDHSNNPYHTHDIHYGQQNNSHSSRAHELDSDALHILIPNVEDPFSSTPMRSLHQPTPNPRDSQEVPISTYNSPSSYILERYLASQEDECLSGIESVAQHILSVPAPISVSYSQSSISDPDWPYTVSNIPSAPSANPSRTIRSNDSSCIITGIGLASCDSGLNRVRSSESDPLYSPSDSNSNNTTSDPQSSTIDDQDSQEIIMIASSASNPEEDSEHQSSNDHCVIQPLPERSTLAEFILSQMLKFTGCTLSLSSILLDQPNLHSSQCADLANATSVSTIVRPKQSKSVRSALTDIPNVLFQPGFLSHSSYRLRPDTADLIYSGTFTVEGSTHTESLSFCKSESQLRRKVTPIMSYDIDSVLAFPNSLSFAKAGLKIAFAPGRFTNIHSDLHIRVSLSSLPDLPVNVKSAKISEIPHFQLGHVSSAEDFQLYILFPYLMEPNRPTTYLRDSQLEHFMDDILLRAIYDNCPSTINQHLPGSFEMAKLNSLAAGLEPATRHTATTGRTQLFRYHIPHQYLHQIWNTIQDLGYLPGNHHLSRPILFLNAKNLKLATMSPRLDLTVNAFHKMWNLVCNSASFNPDTFWLDIATEVIHESRRETFDNSTRQDNQSTEFDPSGSEAQAFTFMWRECCLKSYSMAFSNLFPNEAHKADIYEWALTKDIVNMTLTPGRTHTARRSGLAYSQFYSTTKEIFDAGKVYPFQNPALEGLAVDSKLNQTWREIGGHTHWNSNTVSEAYLASKKRAEAGLAASMDKSFGTRQEHRVDLLLLNEIASKFRMNTIPTPDFQSNAPPSPSGHFPYLVSPTSEIERFLRSNINRFCFGLEYVLHLTRNQRIDWEHTRVMVMFLRLLKTCYSGMQLSRYPELAAQTYTNPRNQTIHMGLNIKQTIDKRGYGFLPTNMIDWELCQFRSDKMALVGFTSPYLERIFLKRSTDITTATNHFHLFTRVLTNIGKHRGNRLLLTVTSQILSCTLIEVFRGDIWSSISSDDTPIDNQYRALLEPASSLCLSNLKKLFNSDLSQFKFIMNYNRHQFHPFERVTYLWDYDTSRKRKSWENKEWRTLFQLVCDRLAEYYPQRGTQGTFRNTHFLRFLKHNLVFPQPVNGSFHQKIKSKDKIQQRVWFCAYNSDNQFRWKAHEWSCGSPTPGSYNSLIPSPLPYTSNALSELAACVDINGVSHTKLEALASVNNHLVYEDGHIVAV